MAEKDKKRHPIICDVCGAEMVFAKEILESPKRNIIYLKYVCPHREGEEGCAAIKRLRFERDSNLRFQRTKDGFFIKISAK